MERIANPEPGFRARLIALGGGIDASKRIVLAALLLILQFDYVTLTNTRYTGQGLQPQYLSFATVSDVLSFLTFLLLIVPVILSLVNPDRISLTRVLSAAMFSLGLLWVEFGVKRYGAGDFSPESSVILLTAIFLEIAVIGTKDEPERSRIGLVMRILRRTVALILLYTAFAFSFSFFYPTYTEAPELSEFNADAGVVFGAAVWSGNQLGNRPSPTLRERIDVGYQLLKEGIIPRLVVTGSSAPGEQAESEVARNEIMRRGIDPAAIIAESESHSTFEQVRYLRDELMKKQGWTRFIAISDQYHLARIMQICHFNGVRAIGTPSGIRQPFADLLFYRVRESVALLAYWLLGK